jgi:hypothetical protein
MDEILLSATDMAADDLLQMLFSPVDPPEPPRPVSPPKKKKMDQLYAPVKRPELVVAPGVRKKQKEWLDVPLSFLAPQPRLHAPEPVIKLRESLYVSLLPPFVKRN